MATKQNDPRSPRTSTDEVNEALDAAGLAVRIVRDPAGYYWFDDASTAIPSIYAVSLRGYSTAEVVQHVRDALDRLAARRRP